ncbi:DM13 domain-containing protein [Rhodobacteraceae bacterium NNCM2]|nr:DM13 domain-containing protein [Coraliihabitans acroporae]
MKLMTPSAIVLGAMLVLGACAEKHEPAPDGLDGPIAKTATGAFTGKSKHVTTGHASIAFMDGHWVVILEDDFTFDGAPDPHVALGHDGYRKDAALGMLLSDDGKQIYRIPASLDVADFNEVWIWCDEFAVPLGMAPLKLI